MQLELLKQKNMKLGNPHLTQKLSAMTEAAIKADNDNDDDVISTPTSPNMNGKRVVINLDDFKDATSLWLTAVAMVSHSNRLHPIGGMTIRNNGCYGNTLATETIVTL